MTLNEGIAAIAAIQKTVSEHLTSASALGQAIDGQIATIGTQNKTIGERLTAIETALTKLRTDTNTAQTAFTSIASQANAANTNVDNTVAGIGLIVKELAKIPDILKAIEIPTAPPPDTTPVPIPKPVALLAEKATLEGATYIATHNPGYTGAGYADIDKAGSGLVHTFAWPVNGTVKVDLRFANGYSVRYSNPLFAEVNGVTIGVLQCPPDGNWMNWRTESITVPVVKGVNVLRIGAVNNPGPNVDTITVTHLTSTVPTEPNPEPDPRPDPGGPNPPTSAWWAAMKELGYTQITYHTPEKHLVLDAAAPETPTAFRDYVSTDEIYVELTNSTKSKSFTHKFFPHSSFSADVLLNKAKQLAG